MHFSKIAFAVKLFLLFLLLNPQAAGQSVSLNGSWDFTADSLAQFSFTNVSKNADWKTAVVPGSLQAQFDELRDYFGISWYRKRFNFNMPGKDKAVILNFAAVDYIAEVYVNGQHAGKHEGGYTPFDFDITSFVKSGENEILVRVVDPAATETGTEGISYWNIPHGKQSWYVQTSGLWQPVKIEVKPAVYIRHLHLTPEVSGRVKINIKLNKKLAVNETCNLIVTSPSGAELINESRELPAGDSNYSMDLSLSNPKLWSFDTPALYTAVLTIPGDSVKEQFGFRSFEAKNGMLYLNGEPFYLIAALDQDFYPETIYTTPSEEYIRDEMIKAKKLGLNMLRCHIKAPDPVYLKCADELGLLVWYEIPNWDNFSSDAAARGEQTMDEMLQRDWNHPSLVILTIINESWGIDLQKKEQREWLAGAYDRLKQKAVGRLVVDNSACYPNFHIKTDINDYHTYWSIPENRHRFDETIAEVASRPSWLFSSFGDARQKGDEPLLISEFGNWGLPKLPEKLPWWFSRPFGDAEVAWPKDVHTRFDEYGYDDMFGSYDALAEQSQHAQFAALKYEIESLRLQNPIQGYVITEFTDINWESNGLLDMRRNFKIYSDILPSIQQQDVIIPRTEKYSYVSGDNAQIKLYFSHYSSEKLSSPEISWQSTSGKSGKINVKIPKRGSVVEQGIITVPVEAAGMPGKETINFTLRDGEEIIADNFIELYVFPAEKKSAYAVYDPADKLTSLKNHGGTGSTIICSTIDEHITALLNEGKTIICFADSNSRFPSSFPFTLKSRSSDWLDGNWATNFNWVKNNVDPFKNYISGNRIGFESAGLEAGYVLTGIPGDNFNDVLSGMFVGWLHMNSAYILQMNAGKGKLIICSLPVHMKYGEDAYSTWMVNTLVEYASGSSFYPVTNWKF